MAEETVTPLLRATREAAKYPLKVVANAVGCSVSTLSRIESGAVQPARETARAIFWFFDGKVPLEHIYDPEYAPILDRAKTGPCPDPR